MDFNKFVVLALLLSALKVSVGHVVQKGENFSRKLKQANISENSNEECFKGSKQVLTQYPYEVALRNPVDKDEPNVNVLCGGSLIDKYTILTSAGCIWQQVQTGIPYNLNVINPVNNTFDIPFKAAIAPYCQQGDGAELVGLYGYQLMDGYDGWPAHGNAAALIKISQPGSSIPKNQVPKIREAPLSVGSKLSMIGFGAQTNAQASIQDLSSSYPFKKVEYITISDSQCQRLINQLFEDKQLDPTTESCAVVNSDFDIGVCNGDDGSTLVDEEGNIAGVLTWWTVNRCEVKKDNTMPIVFADVSKTSVARFIQDASDKPLTIPPNFTDGCEDGQFFDQAPFAVSIQLPQISNDQLYHHICNAILIDSGKRILTSASCIWNNFFPSPDGMSVVFDLRAPGEPLQGDFYFMSFFASLAPRCRNLNSNFSRSRISSYHIHPSYNGNPNDGYDIAILDLDTAFQAEYSFDSLQTQLLEELDIRDFSDATFYGWGASYSQEARQDEKGVFNNFTPIKATPMKLISDNKCMQTILLEDTKNTLFREIEFCALLDYQSENFQDLCIYDVGGPLISYQTGEPVVLGLMTKQQDRLCLGGGDFPKVFTEIAAMSDFILGIIRDQGAAAVARSSAVVLG